MIELEDLSNKHPATVGRPNDDPDSNSDSDGDEYYPIPSGILLVVSSIFLCVPGFAFYLASNASTEHAATPLERFLITHLGIYLSVVGVSLLLRVCSIYSRILHTIHTDLPQTSRHPLLIPLTFGSSLSAFLSYNSTTVGSFSNLFFLSQITLSLWGFYTILFGDEAPDLHRSKTTGADKKTSSFIFGNRAAASIRKKEWRKKVKDGN